MAQIITFNSDLSNCYNIDGIVECLIPQILNCSKLNCESIKNMFNYILDFVSKHRIKWYAHEHPECKYNEDAECYIPEPMSEDIKTFVLEKFIDSFELYFQNCYIHNNVLCYYEENIEKLNNAIKNNTNHSICKSLHNALNVLHETQKKRIIAYNTIIGPYIKTL